MAMFVKGDAIIMCYCFCSRGLCNSTLTFCIVCVANIGPTLSICLSVAIDGNAIYVYFILWHATTLGLNRIVEGYFFEASIEYCWRQQPISFIEYR